MKTSDLLRRLYGSAGTLLNTILSRLEVPRRSSIDPSKLFNGSGSGRYIVVYRCQRSYVSSVIEPGDLSKIFGESASELILDHHVAPPTPVIKRLHITMQQYLTSHGISNREA